MRCSSASVGRYHVAVTENLIERIGMIWTQSNLSLGRRRTGRELFSTFFNVELLMGTEVDEWSVAPRGERARERETERMKYDNSSFDGLPKW